MDEDKGLVLPRLVKELLVADFIHHLESLDSFLFGDTDELLLESTQAVGSVKVEESF